MAVTLVWKVFAIAVAKKATLYILARSYGFPRLYRRIMEFNRLRITDRSRRRSIQNKVKYIIRIPNKIGRRMGVLLWGQQSIPTTPNRR